MSEIDELVAEYVQSVNNLDQILARKIWSSQGGISFIHPRGHERGWAQIWRQFYMQTMGSFSSRRLEIVGNISIIEIDQDSSWGEFYWKFDAVFNDGVPLHTEGRETQIWRRDSEGWKILHAHYSGMPVLGARAGF